MDSNWLASRHWSNYLIACLLIGLGMDRVVEGQPLAPAKSQPNVIRRTGLELLQDEHEINVVVKSMNDSEKQSLLQKVQRFQAEPVERQQTFRRQHAELVDDPHAERLYRVLTIYHDWLAALPAGQRAELLDLHPTERLERIRELKLQQRRDWLQENAAELTDQDVNAIRTFIAAYVATNRRELESQLSTSVRERLERTDNPQFKTWMLAGAIARGEIVDLPEIGVTEAKQLESNLSPRALDVWRQAGERKTDLIPTWVWVSAKRRMSDVPTAKLEAFYLQLEASERDALDELPPQEMKQRLQRMYYRSRFRERREPRPAANGSSRSSRDD